MTVELISGLGFYDSENQEPGYVVLISGFGFLDIPAVNVHILTGFGAYDPSNDTIGTSLLSGFGFYDSIASADVSVSLATITSPIVDGATGNSGTYSGFTATPTTLTIETTGGAHSEAMTSLSAGAGSFTFNVPGLPGANAARAPYTTASWGLRAKLAVGAESAVKSITHNPPSGYTALEVTGTWSIVSESSFAYGWNAAPGLTSQLVYPTANNLTVNASTGAFTTDQTSGTISYWLWDVADGALKPFTWNFDIIGTMAFTLGDFGFSATGTFVAPVTGTMDFALEDFSVSMSGSVIDPVIGTMAVTLDDFTLTMEGIAAYPITCTMEFALEDLQFTGVGIYSGPVASTWIPEGSLTSTWEP